MVLKTIMKLSRITNQIKITYNNRINNNNNYLNFKEEHLKTLMGWSKSKN